VKKVVIGSTRTGIILQQVEYTNESDVSRDIHSEDRATIVVPLETVAPEHRANLGGFFRKNTRFLAVINETFYEKRVEFAGPIENFTPSNDSATISVACVGMGLFMGRIPVIKPEDRDRLVDQTKTWTVAGTPAAVVNTVFSTVTEESGPYAFPQSLILPTGGSGSFSHTFNLAEITTLKDFTDTLADSYEGFEVIYDPQYIDGATPRIAWNINVGEPHWRKAEEPISISIDQQGGGVTAFSYTENGQEQYNWVILRSEATDEVDPNWIDLEGKTVARPEGDDEYLSLFTKEFFPVGLTAAEKAAQFAARINVANVEMKTFNISVFDEDFDFIHRTGRRLQVTATKRLTGLNEEMRITAVSQNLNDPSSVNLTVQPAALRVYPRLPNRIVDAIKDAVKTGQQGQQWAATPPATTGTGGNVPGYDWNNPGVIDKPFPTEMEKSPLTNAMYLYNQFAKTGGYYSSSVNQITSPVWGVGPWNPQSNGDTLGPDSFTTIPHKNLSRFYALSWGVIATKTDETTQVDPWKLEVFKTRKLSYPTYGPDQVGNYPPSTDENYGYSGTGGLVATIPGQLIKDQMLIPVGPSNYSLEYERLANGCFFRGTGEDEKLVVYIHQLQIFKGEQVWIKSKGFAFEIGISQEDGSAVGDWTVTEYPFYVSDSARSYYPMTSQVESYGPGRQVVACVTPAAYFRDKRIVVQYPTIISDKFWREIGQGKYAIENCTITKNYKLDEVYKTAGVPIDLFKPKQDTDDRWSEAYQLLAYGGELWTTNMSFTSYMAGKKSKDGRLDLAMKFVLKTKIDKDGKPVEWKKVGEQYGYSPTGTVTFTDASYVTNSSITGFKEFVFMGSPLDVEAPTPGESLSIGGKVGAETTKLLYGITPDVTSITFGITDSSSGVIEAAREFWPDFWNFSLTDSKLNNGAGTFWFKNADGVILPIWNGAADTYYSNSTLHSFSSMKYLLVDDWMVKPDQSVSYLLGNDGYGHSYWKYYK
jgi:hypothetical protein